MTVKTNQLDRVCVVSKGYGKGTVNALTYGDGKVHTYHSVHDMDWRIDAKVTAFTKRALIAALRKATPDQNIVTTVSAAMELFSWSLSDFDFED